MSDTHSPQSRSGVLPAQHLQKLFDSLSKSGYSIIGPQLRDGAIVYDRLPAADLLPVGYRDEHDGGHYRIIHDDNGLYFQYVVGPHSVKKFLYPPRQVLWHCKTVAGEMAIEDGDTDTTPYAFLGVRSCELAAVALQDKIFIDGPYADPGYRKRRENAFFVAVNCTRPGGTCFCTSMETGPEAKENFDLSLTEVKDGADHLFIVHCGSARGEAVFDSLKLAAATDSLLKRERDLMHTASRNMGRTLDTAHLRELLQRNDEHPRWNVVGQRCMNCANCTLVCPTCFCVTVEDTTDLTGATAARTRRWDSCFTIDFSYIHGGSVRTSAMARYRQWMTHKLANWHDQFGASGCVGCGRCITWCPVGIDITEEAAAMRLATIQV